MLARAPLHAERNTHLPWAGVAGALLFLGALVHGGLVLARLLFSEPLAGEESLALARDAAAVPAYLGPLHALLLLNAPDWLPGLRTLMGVLPLLGSAALVEWMARRQLGLPWAGVAWAGLVLLLWPAFGPIDAASAAPLLTLAALGAWAATSVESEPGLRAPLAAGAIVAAILLHPAGVALLALPFLLAREDRRQAAAGALAVLATATLTAAGALPHLSAVGAALLDPDAGQKAIEALLAVFPLALPGLVAPFMLVRIERAGPRDPEWSLAAATALLAAGGLLSTPLLGPDALVPAALTGLVGMSLLLAGLAMGRTDSPFRTAAVGSALLVVGILAANLPLRREQIRPTQEDAAARAALVLLAQRLDLSVPGWPHLNRAEAATALRLQDRPANGAEPCLLLPVRPLGATVPYRLYAPTPEDCAAVATPVLETWPILLASRTSR